VRRLEAHLLTCFHKSAFEMQDAFAGPQPCFELIRIERLRQTVVRTRLEARDNVFLRLFRRQQNHVDVSAFLVFPHFTADTRPIKFRHDPLR
jgi:hypothetical protein